MACDRWPIVGLSVHVRVRKYTLLSGLFPITSVANLQLWLIRRASRIIRNLEKYLHRRIE